MGSRVGIMLSAVARRYKAQDFTRRHYFKNPMSENIRAMPKQCSGGPLTALSQVPPESSTKEIRIVVVECGQQGDADEVRACPAKGAILYNLFC